MSEFTVVVTYYSDDDVWVAECDPLGIVTDERSYEALVKRVWEIAPEMAERNKATTSPGRMKLSFVQHTSQLVSA
ncbi:MAG: DUF1902 domain-containing protein [Burkholderiaceae bacterium]|jgi:hypothetical protein|nr:DUF1902 domain-containing protein [Burkholderiaceae bacterium]